MFWCADSTPYITHVPAQKQSNYSIERRRETEQSEKQVCDERVPLNWWVWNGKVFMLNAAPPEGLRSAAVPSPSLRVLLIIPFKWNVNPPFSPVLTMSIPLWLPLSLHLFSISLLRPRLFLFVLILCLALSLSLSISLFFYQCWFFPATCRCFPISSFSSLPEKCGWWIQLCRPLRQESFIIIISTNQSGSINTSAQ